VKFGQYTFTVWPKVAHAVSVAPGERSRPQPEQLHVRLHSRVYREKNVGLVRDSFKPILSISRERDVLAVRR